MAIHFEIIRYREGSDTIPAEVQISAADIAGTDQQLNAGLPAWWPAGVMIHSPGYAAIKEKALDGSWAAL